MKTVLGFLLGLALFQAAVAADDNDVRALSYTNPFPCGGKMYGGKMYGGSVDCGGPPPPGDSAPLGTLECAAVVGT